MILKGKIMKYTKLLLLIPVLILAACNTSRENEEGWKPLFAKDLSNAIYDKGVWEYTSDDVLISNADKMIFSKLDFQNFEISLDFKMEQGANSGIVFYCTDTEKWIPNSLEIQICDSNYDKFKSRGNNWICGAFFGHKAPITTSSTKPIGEWNNMRARFKGQQIDVWINNVLVNSFNLSNWKDQKKNPDGTEIPAWLTKNIKSKVPTVGKVGLQGKHGGAACDFKNVKVRQIKD